MLAEGENIHCLSAVFRRAVAGHLCSLWVDPVPACVLLEPLNSLRLQMGKLRSKQVHAVTCSGSPAREWGLCLAPSGVTQAST